MIKSIEEFDKKTWLEIYNENPDFEIPEVWHRIFYKTYPRFEQIKLDNNNIENRELENLLLKRESTREFTGEPINFNDLSHIIQFSCGKKPLNPDRRMYPSGGARYPLEMYPFIYSVNNLNEGTYHYNILDNTLECLIKEKPPFEIFFGENVKNPSAVLLITGVLARSEIKYLENAYKFALIESGHIAQNINLLSQEMSIGNCCIGGFDNKKLIKHLDLVKEEEIPLYAIALGLPQKEVNKQYIK